jgi:glutamine amidotransferase
MTKKNIVIINTGCANISSVKFALERLNVDVTVSDNAETIKSADKLILPGVGTANAAMNSIGQKALVPLIQSLEQPVLGVCLGMQLMVDLSHEGPKGDVPCLSLIPGSVERMQVGDLRLPHMGWNTVSPTRDNPLFSDIANNSYFYFVHSFNVAVSEFTLATCDYGSPFSAALNKDNFYGVQFHPERSGEAGAQLLRNFVEHV